MDAFRLLLVVGPKLHLSLMSLLLFSEIICHTFKVNDSTLSASLDA